jgi:putative membrane protein
MAKINFTEVDKQQISDAVKKVESQSNGEIVTYFVKKSDSYAEAPFIASFIVVILGLIGVNVLSQMWLLPTKFDLLSYSLVFLGIIVFTFVLFQFIPFLKIGIISEKKEKTMVHKRAMEAFLTEEVFKTKDRTGILIFVSELERNAIILADSGINEKIKQEQWQEIVDKLTLGIKGNITAKALVEAINECGELIVDAGFTKTENDTNELPDNGRL